jgi:CRP-like cAMP-binding protein
VGPDEYFGEIALLTGQTRTADVVAVTPMTMRRLTRDRYAVYLAEMLKAGD